MRRGHESRFVQNKRNLNERLASSNRATESKRTAAEDYDEVPEAVLPKYSH